MSLDQVIILALLSSNLLFVQSCCLFPEFHVVHLAGGTFRFLCLVIKAVRLFILFFNWSKIDLNIILVSGVQHSDLIFLCIMKWLPWCPVTIHHMWLIYFIIGSLYLLICFACLAYPSTPIPSSNHQFDLCIYEPVSVLLCLFICFLPLDSMYK